MKEGTLLLTWGTKEKCYENKGILLKLYSNKLNDLNKMDKFLVRHKKQKLTYEEADNLSRPNEWRNWIGKSTKTQT